MITSKRAIEVIQEVTGKGSRTTLKQWADQGRISRLGVHAKCALYREEEIRNAALDSLAGKQRATLAISEVVGGAA